MQTLESAFPDFLDGDGIFDHLQSFAWCPDTTTAFALNSEYYLNRSGQKVAAPIIDRMVNENGELTNESIGILANIIKARFTHKWDKLWADYSSNTSIFNNVLLSRSTTYGKSTSRTGSDTTTRTGTETSTKRGTETNEESYPTARKSTREISGGYTDTRDITNVRSGTENTTESFPTARTSSKSISGGYADTDTTANTRTGSQLVTDKGETATTSYGFNSGSGVKTQKVGPDNSSTGITTETTYGSAGLKDTKSGAITRAYNQYQEATTESGSRQLSTTYGQDGLSDAEDGTVQRVYNNYKDETTESGTRRTEKSYGQSGITDELSFNNRQDSRSTSSSETNSGTDTESESGYNIRRLSDKLDILTAMYENPRLNNFFEVVYADIDEVLTVPIFM